MTHEKQDQKPARLGGSQKIKKQLIDRGLSITALAKQVGYPRPTVSRAIHQNIFPHVRAKISEVLNG